MSSDTLRDLKERSFSLPEGRNRHQEECKLSEKIVLLQDQIDCPTVNINTVHLDFYALADLKTFFATFAYKGVGGLVVLIVVVGEITHVHHTLNSKINPSHIDAVIGSS